MKKISKVFEKIINFLKKHKKKILVGVLCFLFLVTIVQIFWPKNIMLPFSKIGDSNSSFMSEDKVKEQVEQKLKDSKNILKSSNNSKTELSGEQILKIAKINEDNIKEAFEYPLWWRFVPFFFVAFRSNIDSVSVAYNDEELTHFAEEKSSDLSKQPENALFVVDGDKISIKSSQDGVSVESDDVKKSLQSNELSLIDQKEITVDSKKISPEILTEDYSKLKGLAEKVIAKNIYFMLPIGNKIDKFATTAEERANLLNVVKDENGEYSLTIKDDESSKMFSVLEEKVKKEPGITAIKTINGAEVGRTQGISGQGLNFDDFKSQLNDELFNDDTGEQIDLKIKTIQPTLRYEREFTNSNDGLQSYLDEVTRGKKITVSVQQLSGNYWSASSGGDTRMVSASTYKLFMAQFIMSKIDSGQLSWGSSSLGTNVDTCFYNMIVRSANDCAENWLKTYGRAEINNYLRSLGYSDVFSSSGAAASTTANDLKNILTNLYFGDNFSAGNAQKLKDLMMSQVYRQGIPTGSSAAVSDKVGFLDNVLNDAGIVYHPQGNYVIVIMTEGESWSKIAEITRGVENIMYP